MTETLLGLRAAERGRHCRRAEEGKTETERPVCPDSWKIKWHGCHDAIKHRKGMHREGQPTNRLALSCAFFALMRNQKADSTVEESEPEPFSAESAAFRERLKLY